MYNLDYLCEIIEEHCSAVDCKLMDLDGKNPEILVESFLKEDKEMYEVFGKRGLFLYSRL